MTEQSNLPADVAAASPPAIAKAEMKPGNAIAALIPQSLDDTFRLAKALAASGDMVPKVFQGKPEMTMAAIVRGLEIGLAPMQALSNIAVINGRASIWGDALPALMQRAGHQLDCEVTGDGDAMVATATLVRGDTGQKIVRSFSASDAKAAGLWGKPGPWQQYKPRMLSMRARSLACRDGAADALMGLQVAEEVQDYPTTKDVTPKAGGFSQLAQKARALEPEPQPEPEPQIEEAEIVQPDTTDVDLEGAFPGTDEFTEGAKAFSDGKPLSACPYDMAAEKDKAIDWMGGFTQAKRAQE